MVRVFDNTAMVTLITPLDSELFEVPDNSRVALSYTAHTLVNGQIIQRESWEMSNGLGWTRGYMILAWGGVCYYY